MYGDDAVPWTALCVQVNDCGHAMQMVDLEEVVLPGNARLLYHDNECYDWGTLGWIMSAGTVDVEDYKYFIMINSSVRGPYAPPYMPVGLTFAMPWCLTAGREVSVCSARGQHVGQIRMCSQHVACLHGNHQLDLWVHLPRNSVHASQQYLTL